MKIKYLLLLLALNATGVLACARDPKQPGFEIAMLTDMAHTAAVKAFTSPMRMPPAGTVPHEAILESPDGKANPLAVTPETVVRGKFVYENNCLICHGTQGDGDGPLIPKYPNPPPLSSQRVLGLSSAELFRIITTGKGEMASYAAQVTSLDRWKVVMYVETLQGKHREGAKP